MRSHAHDDLLERGELVRLLYRLGHSRATGVLTVRPENGAADVLVLRRGHLMAPAADTESAAAGRLARLAALECATYAFDGGTAAYPPGAVTRQFSLAGWARRHLEAQVDSNRANELVRLLAGTRLVLRPDLMPPNELLDDTDRRILDALRVPRRLDQVWPLARTPRFRLVTFIHFLRTVGVVECRGVAAPGPQPTPPEADARRLLGVGTHADKLQVKRAYRRLARALHPDLHPSATSERRQLLARKFSEITAAYRELVD